MTRWNTGEELQVLYGEEKLTKISPKEALINALLYVCDFRKSWLPVDSLKENFQGVLDFSIEYCNEFVLDKNLMKSLSVSKQSINFLIRKLTYFINETEESDYRKLCFYYYNLILSTEGLGPLRNFGIGNKWGDILKGNPEKQSMRSSLYRK